MNRTNLKRIICATVAALGLLSFLIPETICDSSTISESLPLTKEAEAENIAQLTPEEFVQHYAEISLIRHTFPDDSTGYAVALAKYLEKTGITHEKMNFFVSEHADDILFWKSIWEKIESELEQRLEIPDDGD